MTAPPTRIHSGFCYRHWYFSIVIPDGSRSEPIRTQVSRHRKHLLPLPTRGAGLHGSRLSRLTALARDDNREACASCDSARVIRGDTMHRMLARLALAMLLVAALVVAPAAAQVHAAEDGATFPNRTIRIVVPFPAGGPSDIVSRLIGQKMSEDWGQPVIIDNRPGANTVLGAQQVAKAAPDGYTLLMAIDSTLTMNQYLYRTPPYDPFNDFAPVTLTAKTMQLLIVNAASDVKTVRELISKAKAQPGKLNYGAGTITTKLTGYLFNKAAGVETVLVPYNGSAEVAQAVLTRSVDFSFDGPSASLSLIQSGAFRVL